MGTGTSLLSLDPKETEEAFCRLGGRPFHARVARQAVFEEGTLSYDGLTSLPKALRERLSLELPVLRGREERCIRSGDGTLKLLIEFPPTEDGRRGAARVETVHLPSTKKGRAATLCVSTQVGCPVACPFCASGKAGLERNLESAEILEQYVRGRALGPLARSVVMGIGEPLLNLENLLRALSVVRAEMGLGARKLTVSTVGFPERLRRLAPEKPPFQLAISLHSVDDALRDRLVPAMAGVPVEEVLAAGDHWFEETGREITYEVVLLGGVNDDREHAQHLASRLRGRRASVNLIPYNPIGEDDWRRPRPPRVEAFLQTLTEGGIVATVRWSKGLDQSAACGQLRALASGKG